MTVSGAAGGRPNAREGARRAPRLRVKRANARREAYELKLAGAVGLPNEVAVTADYVRSALRGNAAEVNFEDHLLIRRLLAQLAKHADRINERAAKQANREGNTPRSRREERESA